jgi:hypothetical protein
MADPSTKTPMGLQEGASRAATYGALVAAILIIVAIGTFLYGSLDRRADRTDTNVFDLRHDINNVREQVAGLRAEFAEFRSETRGEFKVVHRDLDELKASVTEIKELLKARKP